VLQLPQQLGLRPEGTVEHGKLRQPLAMPVILFGLLPQQPAHKLGSA
jgi:hypothetical protein